MTATLNRQQFILRLAPTVQQVRKEGSPLFPSVRLAQNWLETGGNINDWNNLGGFKVGSGSPNGFWKGRVVNKGTWEVYSGQTVNVTAAFRAYDSIHDFYKDQDLLFMKDRYTRVRTAKTPDEQANMLQACGYATDPNYADKIIDIINSCNLKQYDEIEKDEDEMDKATVLVNGKQVTDGLYDAKVGITYVPVRVVSESFGAKVAWDGKTKTVKIDK